MLWERVSGYNGFYEVSNEGDVKSVDRKVKLANGKERFYKGKRIKSRVNNCGYLEVRLSKDGKTRTHFIHRLVAQAFIPNPDNLPQVNHIYGDKMQNLPEFLEWVDCKTNVQDAYNQGLSSNKGPSHRLATKVKDNNSGLWFPSIKLFCDCFLLNYNTVRNAFNGYSKWPKSLNDISFEKLGHTNKAGAINPPAEY